MFGLLSGWEIETQELTSGQKVVVIVQDVAGENDVSDSLENLGVYRQKRFARFYLVAMWWYLCADNIFH